MARKTRSVPPEHGKSPAQWVQRFLLDEMEIRSEEATYDLRNDPAHRLWLLEASAILGAVTTWLQSWPPRAPGTRLIPPAVHFHEPIWDLFLDGIAADLGLSPAQQLIVLHVVRRGGEGPTTRQLATALGLTPRAINKDIAELVRRGLLRRDTSRKGRPAANLGTDGLRVRLERASRSRPSRK